MSALTAEVTTITPEWARQIIAEQAEMAATSSVKQRRVDRCRVAQYANEMKLGAWKLNGEPIQFNGTRLLNGQHRLAAVVRANVPVPFLVVRGVDLSAFATIDQGKGRTIGDILSIAGLTQVNEVAAIGRASLMYETAGNLRPSYEMRPTRRQVFEYVEKWGDPLHDAVKIAKATTLKNTTVLGSLAFLVRAQDERREFFSKLTDGVGLTKDDPARHLRERLLALNGSNVKVDYSTTFALATKAWNSFYRRQPMAQLRFTVKEEYPVLLR